MCIVRLDAELHAKNIRVSELQDGGARLQPIALGDVHGDDHSVERSHDCGRAYVAAQLPLCGKIRLRILERLARAVDLRLRGQLERKQLLDAPHLAT